MLSRKYPTIAVVVVTRNRINALKRCLLSLGRSVIKISEIVVVDNASSDGSLEMVKKNFPKIRLLVQKENTGAARGRNIGARATKSNLLYFLDDDAYVEPKTFKSATQTLLTDQRIAIVQSKVLSSKNPKKILGIGHDINTTTSLITALGINETDQGQYLAIMDIPMVGTGWLIKREAFNLVNGFDNKFFVPYEDSDISIRIRQKGYRIVFDPRSQIWHDEEKVAGVISVERAFYVGRNKIYFMRKHSKGIRRLVFFIFFLPLFIVYHCTIILSGLRFDILKSYLRGIVLGFKI